MKKNKLIKKIICGATICSMGIAALTLGGCKASEVNTQTDYIGNLKYQATVMSELDANMQIMEMFNSEQKGNSKELLRLKPNDTNKIYVGISDDIPNRTKENINKVVEQYNKVFSYVNDAYEFETCSLSESYKYSREDKTTIKFRYGSLAESTIGTTHSSCYFNDDIKEYQTTYISNSIIYLNSDFFNELIDDCQMLAIKHELAHALGFADIYTIYGDETSIVNHRLLGLSTYISPNDFKMIYVAYGNKHINEDGSYNKEKMDEVKQIIKKYENKYYDYFIGKIKNLIIDGKTYNNKEMNISNFQKISKEEISGVTFTKNDVPITIDGDKFTYVVDGKVQTGELITGEDYIVLPDIILKNPYDKETPYNDFLVLFKTNDKIGCYNLDIYNTSLVQDKTEEDLGIMLMIR